MTAKFSTPEDCREIEREMPWPDRDVAPTIYGALSATAKSFPDRSAVSFQMFADAGSKAETLSWGDLHRQVTQAANLFHSLGIGEDDTVAYLLPNATETVATMLGGMTAGIVCPINPLLEPAQIAGILNATGAKVLVTLRTFPRTDLAQKAAKAIAKAESVTHILEIDLKRHVGRPKRWAVPFARPRLKQRRKVRVIDFNAALEGQPGDILTFGDAPKDRVAAYFHTGGTTGTPKLTQHNASGILYNGWLGRRILFDETDVLMCPLPLFHVFACYPVMMSALLSGAHVILPTPAGYRGDGVFDNFWKLIDRWQVTFLITVPTAVSALMSRKVDADVGSLKTAISGSAPLPKELARRFEEATGVKIAEGYGLTEATCLVSCNPIDGEKKIGSVGVPLPYTSVRILECGDDGVITRTCDTDEIGEICVANPGVDGARYVDADRNAGLYADGYLRTGDMGRMDADGYLWITGRSKDLIIRGGHNIDPAEIESALMGHDDVAYAAAIGEPHFRLGEMPCAYVELVDGATATAEALTKHAKQHIHERAAVPKHVEVLDTLPKTAVGKVYKPELRKRAIARVLDGDFDQAGLSARVAEVEDDSRQGLVAVIAASEAEADKVAEIMGDYALPWRWHDGDAASD